MSRAHTAVDHQGNYRIEVADFGPIRHATVDLRPLTVFAGPSNTGKSYLAMLIYALHECFGPHFPTRSGGISSRNLFRFESAIVESLWDRGEVRQSIVGWWSEYRGSRRASLPDDLVRTLRPMLERLPGGGHYLAQEVRRCFAAEAIEDLVRRESRDNRAVVALEIPDERGRQSSRFRAEFGSNGVQVSARFGVLPQVCGSSIDDSEYPGNASYLLHLVVTDVFESLTRPLARRAFYLPADRTGVMHSHQVVVSTLIQSATAAGRRPSVSVPLLSGVLADFLDGLIGMSRPTRKSSIDLADVLEQNLLAGAVRLDSSETGYPSFVYRPVSWDSDLPLTRTSSMVSELAPVVLYLRHCVEPGNVLIIEEPEAHLHPALQARFARELARLVHAGVRVVLTTHSEWILEVLANLVRMSELSEGQRKGIPGADVALAPQQVGAWLFKPDADGAGSAVEEMPLDTDAGTFPAGFGEITEALYNEWARISNRIEAAKPDPSD